MNHFPKGIVDIEQLNKEGYTPYNLNVDGCNSIDDGNAGNTSQAGKKTDNQGKDNGKYCYLKGFQYSVGNKFKYVPIGIGPYYGEYYQNGDSPEERDLPCGKQGMTVFVGN